MNILLKSNTHPLIYAVLLLVLSIQSNSYAEVYKENSVFIKENFSEKTPPASYIWLTKDDLKQQVKNILKHPYDKLRVKYWMIDNKSAWILEEIGKEELITTGIIIEAGKITKMEILAFRESRGWEIKYPFFLKQFINAALKKDNTQLDQTIDGITGATLSVRAVTKLARLALLLHNHIIDKK